MKEIEKSTARENWVLEFCFFGSNSKNVWHVINSFSTYNAAYEAMDKAFRNTQGLFLVVYRVVRVY